MVQNPRTAFLSQRSCHHNPPDPVGFCNHLLPKLEEKRPSLSITHSFKKPTASPHQSAAALLALHHEEQSSSHKVHYLQHTRALVLVMQDSIKGNSTSMVCLEDTDSHILSAVFVHISEQCLGRISLPFPLPFMILSVMNLWSGNPFQERKVHLKTCCLGRLRA